MHFHADHTLFFEERQNLWRPTLSLGITLCALITNAGASDTTVSVVGSAVAGVLLLMAYASGHRRMEPALTWTLALIVSAVLCGVALGGDVDRFIEAAARVGCGVMWVLWLGTQLDWSSLRQMLLVARVPETVVESLDHAVMNGVLTQREWIRRRNAARLRLGRSRLPLRAWAQLLGEGALAGFLRLECMEEAAVLRSSPPLNTTDDDAILLDSVRVEREGHVVLDQIDLRIHAGEWVLLCGASGAGKSSLLRVLAGLNEPVQGTMNRLGVGVSSDTKLQDRLDGRVAFLSQNPEHHFIASTVAEDIAWGLLRRGVEASEARRRAEEMAKQLGIVSLLDRPCHALSFGEQRRVALAGLLVLEPALLLLDEPTSGLDPVAAHDLLRLVERSIQRTGAACIWATHDLHSLPPQAERIVLLRDGQSIFDGSTGEGLSKPWLMRAGLAIPEGVESAC